MGKKTKYWKNLSREERLALIQKRSEQEKVLVQVLRNSDYGKNAFRRALGELIESDDINSYSKNATIHLVQKLNSKMPANRDKNFFTRTLLHLEKQKCIKLVSDEKFITAIFNMARFSLSALNAPEEWERSSHNVHKQFSSLVRFCFAKYDLPLFMDQAWFSNNDVYMKWFLRIAKGDSLRNCYDVPIHLTKKIVHNFMQADDTMTINEALRWAQVLGYGGDLRMANTIVAGHLGRNNFDNEVFWEKVIQFFSKCGMVERNKLNEIIDFLDVKSREDGSFSLKGRTMNSLIKLSDEWHRDVNRERARGGKLIWQKSGIREFSVDEGKKEKKMTYTVLELLSTNELSDEGRKMNHCVSTYAISCQQQKRSIFSIRAKDILDQETRLATIEVHLDTKKIVQAKSRFNKPIGSTAERVMRKWAHQEGLSISNYL